MLFNSLNFAIFLPIVFVLYWWANKDNYKLQNLLLLVASYFFYACWDWRFMFLLIFSTFLDYFTGIKIQDAIDKKGKLFWLWLSIGINLGFLGVFKYYNFFTASLIEGLQMMGLHANFSSLKIILPVGISFYTFHGLSYVIDIYKERIKPERNFIAYSVFVSFFPLLVAGPIERATHLLPQILKPRRFDYANAIDGLRQMLWGLFKKVVIADNCATYANEIFNNSAGHGGSSHVLGAICFAFQIYCDFSGYSDIALGTARLFGMSLLRNFAFPYFSRDIAEFWRRWHISLSSWFKDYLYIPLGGSKGGMWVKVRNTFIIFIVSGFWHGANWTFILWGFLNALFIMPSIIFNTNRNNLEIVAKSKLFPNGKELFQMVTTFALTCLAWIFFRADSVGKAIDYLKKIFSNSIIDRPYPLPPLIILIVPVFMAIEWIGREQQYAIAQFTNSWAWPIRWIFYLMIIACILFLQGSSQTFIYFQF